MLQNHNRLLEVPLIEGCVFAVNSKGVRDLLFANSAEEAKSLMAVYGAKKAQVCVIVADDNESTIRKELIEAVEKIRRYYDYVTGSV